MKLIAALLLSVSLTAHAETPCDEWANFTKIITYRFRDTGKTEKEVKNELIRTMGDNAEIEQALGWVGYAYANPKLNAIQIWEGVYTACNGKPTL
jgi:hypothetical protein